MPTPILPLWLATIILTVVLIGVTEAAFRLSRILMARKTEQEIEADGGGAGVMLSAALALLGLLVGFTFAMASDRFDARRSMVNEEANAIGTAYLRSRLTIGPDAEMLPTLWANYAEARYAIRFGKKTRTEQLALIERGNEIQTRIWQATQREVGAARDDVTAELIDATNAAFDIASSRLTAAQARIPPSIIWGVILYAAVACAILGHALAADRRRVVMSSVLTGLVSLSLAMIIDLDRPDSGAVQVSQAPMQRTVALIRAWQAADRKAAATVEP